MCFVSYVTVVSGFLAVVFFPFADFHADLEPEFVALLPNITLRVGGNASFTCVVENLGSYKIAWIRIESKTALSIHKHIMVKNNRLALDFRDNMYWTLYITNLDETDTGGYMCQVNTVPMRSISGYLNVLVPPAIIEPGSNAEVLVREGSNITITCKARGNPPPTVWWQRDNEKSYNQGILYEGPIMTIVKVSRLHMGPYLCLASSTVSPSASRKILLQVHFPPMIWIPNQLIGADVGGEVILECHTEAYPMSINYWTKEDSGMIANNDKYTTFLQDSSYNVHMKLTIHQVHLADFGSYKCFAKNSIGSTEGSIRLYEINNLSGTKKQFQAEKENLDEISMPSVHHTFRKEGQERRKGKEEMLDDSLSKGSEVGFRSPPHRRQIDKNSGSRGTSPRLLLWLHWVLSGKGLISVLLCTLVLGT